MRRFGLMLVIIAVLVGLAVGGFLLLNNMMASKDAAAPPPPPPTSPMAAPAGADAADPAVVFEGIYDRAGGGPISAQFLSFQADEIQLEAAILKTEVIGTVTASDRIAQNGPTFQEALGLSGVGVAQLRRVTGGEPAELATTAVCSPGPATFLVVGYGPGPEGTAQVSVIGFQGATQPGPEAPTAALCGPGTRFAKAGT